MENPFDFENSQPKKSDGNIKIYLEKWRAMHPFPETIYPSDKYYQGIAQKIADILVKNELQEIFSKDYVLNVALSLAAYFEDVVSELGLFRGFVARYRQEFKREFPWYRIEEEYYDDEVNYVDVRFVMWLAMYANEEDKIPNPENPEVDEIAREIYDLLLDEFENAPVNSRLVQQIYDKKILEDPGKLKAIFMWMSLTCYLLPLSTYPKEALQRDLEQLHDIFHFVKSNPALGLYLDSNYAAFTQRRGPLALYPKEWYVLMRQTKGLTDGNQEILEMDCTGFYPFVVVKNNGKTITMRACHGQEFEVNKNSFSSSEIRDLRVGDMVVTMLFSYKGLWNICGMAGTQPFHDKDLALEKQSRMESQLIDDNRNCVDLLGHVDEHVPGSSLLGPTFDPDKCEELVRENEGDRMFYFKNIKQMDKWVKKHLNPAKEDVPDRNMDTKPMALYIDNDYHLLICEMARMVHDPQNPYYSPEYDSELLSYIIDTNIIPNEMVAYMLNRGYLDRLKLNSILGEESALTLMQDNIHFFLTLTREYPFCK